MLCEHDNPFMNEKGAVLSITNVFAIAILILESENGDKEVLYQYNDGTKDLSKMQYDENGEPFFMTNNNVKYYIKEFMRNTYGKY